MTLYTRLVLISMLAVCLSPALLFATDPPVVAVKVQEKNLGGAAGAFKGKVDGQSYIFKHNAPNTAEASLHMRTGNVEGEFLAARLLEAAGLETADVRLVRVRGKKGLYSMGSFIGSRYQGDVVYKSLKEAKINIMADSNKAYNRLDVEQVRKLQVLDLIMGNGDRHNGNFFLRKTRSGKLRLIAIDHNFAFVTPEHKPDLHLDPKRVGWQRNFVKSFDGTSTFGATASQAGRVQLIMNRNDLYWLVSSKSTSAASYHSAVSEVTSSLSDAAIERMLKGLPSDISAERVNEIRETLKWRRDNVGIAIENYLQSKEFAFELNARSYLRSKGVLVTSAMEEFIITKSLRAIPQQNGTVRYQLDFVEGYYHLRTHGASPADARAVLREAATHLTSDSTKFKATNLSIKEAASIVEPTLAIPRRTKPEPMSSRMLASLKRSLASLKSTPLETFKVSKSTAAITQRLQQLDVEYTRLDRELKGLRSQQSPNKAREIQIVEQQVRILNEYQRRLGKIGADSNYYSLQKANNEMILKRAELAELSGRWKPTAGRPQRNRRTSRNANRNNIVPEFESSSGSRRSSRDSSSGIGNGSTRRSVLGDFVEGSSGIGKGTTVRRGGTQIGSPQAVRNSSPASLPKASEVVMSSNAVSRGIPLKAKPTPVDSAQASRQIEALRSQFGSSDPKAKLKEMVERGEPGKQGGRGQATAHMIKGQLSFTAWLYLIEVFRCNLDHGPGDGSVFYTAFERVTAPSALAGQGGFMVYHALSIYRVLPHLLRRIPPVVGAVIVSTVCVGVIEMFERGETSWDKIQSNPIMELGRIAGIVAERHWRTMVLGTVGAMVGGFIGTYIGMPTLGALLGAEGAIQLMHLVDDTAENIRQSAVRAELGEIDRLIAAKRKGESDERSFWRATGAWFSEKILAIEDVAGRQRQALNTTNRMTAQDFERLSSSLNQLVMEYQSQYEALSSHIVREQIQPLLMKMEENYAKLLMRPDQYLVERIVALAILEDQRFLNVRKTIKQAPSAIALALNSEVERADRTSYYVSDCDSLSISASKSKWQDASRIRFFYDEFRTRMADKEKTPIEMLRELNHFYDLSDGWLGFDNKKSPFYGGLTCDRIQGGRPPVGNALARFASGTTVSLGIPQKHAPVYAALILADHKKMNELLKKLYELHRDAIVFFEGLRSDMDEYEKAGKVSKNSILPVLKTSVNNTLRRARADITTRVFNYSLYMLGKREAYFGVHEKIAQKALNQLVSRLEIDRSFRMVVKQKRPIEEIPIWQTFKDDARFMSSTTILKELFEGSTAFTQKAKYLALLRAYFVNEAKRTRRELDRRFPNGWTKGNRDEYELLRYRHKHSVENLSNFTDTEAQQALLTAGAPIAQTVPLTEENKKMLITELRAARKKGHRARVKEAMSALGRFADGCPERQQALFGEMTREEIVSMAPFVLPARESNRDFLLKVLAKGYVMKDGTRIDNYDPELLQNYVMGLHKTYGRDDATVNQAVSATLQRLYTSYVFSPVEDERMRAYRLAAVLRRMGNLAKDDWFNDELLLAIEARLKENPPKIFADELRVALAHFEETWKDGVMSEEMAARYGAFLRDNIENMAKVEQGVVRFGERSFGEYYLAALEKYGMPTEQSERRAVMDRLFNASRKDTHRWSFATAIREHYSRSDDEGSEMLSSLRTLRNQCGDVKQCKAALTSAVEMMGAQKSLLVFLSQYPSERVTKYAHSIVESLFVPRAYAWNPDGPTAHQPLVEFVVTIAVKTEKSEDEQTSLTSILTIVSTKNTARSDIMRGLLSKDSEACRTLLKSLVKDKGWPVDDFLLEARFNISKFPAVEIVELIFSLEEKRAVSAASSLIRTVGFANGEDKERAMRIIRQRAQRNDPLGRALKRALIPVRQQPSNHSPHPTRSPEDDVRLLRENNGVI